MVHVELKASSKIIKKGHNHDCCALLTYSAYTVRVENFEVVLISRFSWVADDTKIIHVEGGINTREIF